MQLLGLKEQSSHHERQYSVEENIPILVPQLSEEIQIPPVVTSVLGEEPEDHFVNDTNSISAHLGSGNSGNPGNNFSGKDDKAFVEDAYLGAMIKELPSRKRLS
ncbi:hypothetical protein LWI29_014461 [Acer saccharum]|uniref:Uncharacterized protein n=1 Tax=Acer saccharum TaxID=4024 RepID=A0AA39RWL0_ACESA|nr:hypothetical protein LWI29_014461 [Acer saccharum]